MALGVTLAVISYARTYYSDEDFADHVVPPSARSSRELSAAAASTGSRRVFGRPFVTAGWIVVVVTTVVIILEFTILFLILHM